MSTREHVLKQGATWLFLAPVSGLELTAETNYEYVVDQVIFVDASRLPRRRKRLGFPVAFSVLKKTGGLFFKRFLDEEKTFATFRRRGGGEELQSSFLQLAREELLLLSLSQLGFSKRRNMAAPTLAQERRHGLLSYLMLNTDNASWWQQNVTTGKYMTLRLDQTWVEFQRRVFFFDLLKIIRGDTKVAKGWRRDLRNAAILVGQSQCSQDLAQAFLWNMIALEVLLTKQGDVVTRSLPERAEALLGWVTDWEIERYEERIREAYSKRCQLVHQARRDLLGIEDVIFTDDLLLNLFVNIVRHPSLFGSKDGLIKFAEQVQAERVLGIKPQVRPKTFNFLRRKYRDEDYRNL